MSNLKFKKVKFGTLYDGRKVHLYTVSNGSMSFSAIDYGCTITSILLPAKGGKKVDVLLIDEASMVGKSLYNFIDDAMNRGLVKCIIWVSDKHQLDPVLDEINPIYNKDIHKYQKNL